MPIQEREQVEIYFEGLVNIVSIFPFVFPMLFEKIYSGSYSALF